MGSSQLITLPLQGISFPTQRPNPPPPASGLLLLSLTGMTHALQNLALSSAGRPLVPGRTLSPLRPGRR